MAEGRQIEYLSDEVRKYDYDRWLSALLMPADRREDVLTLLAFNAEIARVRETVSEVLLGDIRLQWWRDALTGLRKGKALDHPVVQALQKTVSGNPLDVKLLEDMIDARGNDLDPAPFETADQLLTYADGTGGILSAQIYSVLSGPEEEGMAAARQMGKAFALSGIIRAIPHHVSQDLLLIPASVLAEEGLTADTVFTRKNREAFFRTVGRLSVLAEREYQSAREMIGQRPRAERAAFRLNALTGLYLKRLKSSGMDPASPLVNVGKVRKIWTLFRA